MSDMDSKRAALDDLLKVLDGIDAARLKQRKGKKRKPPTPSGSPGEGTAPSGGGNPERQMKY